MAALYRGLIVAGVLALIAYYPIVLAVGSGDAAAKITTMSMFRLLGRRPSSHRCAGLDHRVLHRHRLCSGEARGFQLPNRPCHQHHCRYRCVDEGLHYRSFRCVSPSTPPLPWAGCSALRSRLHPCSQWPASSSPWTPTVRLPTTPAASRKCLVLPKEVRDVTDPLDAVGNTTKAVTKATPRLRQLAALVLFADYPRSGSGRQDGPDLRPFKPPGHHHCLFIGGSPLPLRGHGHGVGRSAGAVVVEVPAPVQRKIAGIMEARPSPIIPGLWTC